MPSIVTSALFFWCLCRLRQTEKPSWWIAAGAAAGLGLLSKFSALFLGLGTVIWLVADRGQRRWLLTPWPWAAGALALVIFAPNLLWQSSHQWGTFAFQFGRIDKGHFTLRYLGEFLAAEAGLATPLVFMLMLAGLWAGRTPGTPLFLPAVLVATAFAYFLVHALHARVQGNWPCFLFPMLSVLAAAVLRTEGRWRWVSLPALPLAALMLVLAYAQAGWSVIPLRHDPVARILGRQFRPVASVAAAQALMEVSAEPSLQKGAAWLAAALGSTHIAGRRAAARALKTLLDEPLARRQLAARGIELADPELVATALAEGDAFEIDERAALLALAGQDVPIADIPDVLPRVPRTAPHDILHVPKIRLA